MDKKIKLGLIAGALFAYYFYKHKDDEHTEVVHHVEQPINTTNRYGKCELSVIDQNGQTSIQTIPMCRDGYVMKLDDKQVIKCPGSGSYTSDDINYNYSCSFTSGQSTTSVAYDTIEKKYDFVISSRETMPHLGYRRPKSKRQHVN